jgi:hypothetical protein
MAKRKKKSTSRRAKRRVSGLPGNFTPVLAAVGGAVAGKLLSNFAKNNFGLNNTVAGAATVGVGALLVPMLIKGPMGSAVGMGVAAAGGIELAGSFGISGVSDFYNLNTINGMKRVAGARQRLAGDAKQSLAGVDLVNSTANVRQYKPGTSHNFATGRNEMQVVSGIPDTVYASQYCN